MILQYAGVHRRQELETVVTSGWSVPVGQAPGFLLRIEQEEAWLRVRAELALSFLQQRDTAAEDPSGLTLRLDRDLPRYKAPVQAKSR